MRESHLSVMAGLDPAIHAFLADEKKDVDARDKPGHDEGRHCEERSDEAIHGRQ
jgi:hypothetical protein